MHQTTLSVVLELQPRSVGHASDLLQRWRQSPAAAYDQMKAALPALHFLSGTVFYDGRYDPILAVEANVDGDAAPFWAALETAYCDLLRDLVRCCKRPANGTSATYDAIVADASRHPVAPYLEALSRPPMVFHHGNRGLDRARIEREAALFQAARQEIDLDHPQAYAAAAPAQVHATLRAAMLPAFPWLDAAPDPRIAKRERAADLWNLFGFLMLLVFCLSLPGTLAASFSHAGRLAVLIGLLAALAGWGVLRVSDAPAEQKAPRSSGRLMPSRSRPLRSLANTWTLLLAVVAFLVLYLFLTSWVLAIPVWLLSTHPFGIAWRGTARALELGLLSVLASLPVVLLWLRWLERHDSSHDDPKVLPENQNEMARLEDQDIAQNHMASLVVIKPGLLRMALVMTGLWGLGLILRVTATDGYLGSMRTIHFAHWAMANNRSRLLFFSNFDGSWESYLDDFIEKAHGGLSLAWGNSTGFPPARFLVLDGASHGRRFKAWARHSMAPSLFWFSAYPDLTVDQIERQAKLAEGLARRTLAPEEAAEWIRTL